MKKTLALSAVLILGVLGAACPEPINKEHPVNKYTGKEWKVVDIRGKYSNIVVLENMNDSLDRTTLDTCAKGIDSLMKGDRIKIVENKKGDFCSIEIERIK